MGTTVFFTSTFNQFLQWQPGKADQFLPERQGDTIFRGLLSVWAKIDMVHNLQFGNIFFIDVIVSLLNVIFSKSSIIIYWFRFQIKISIWLIHLCAILIWNDKTKTAILNENLSIIDCVFLISKFGERDLLWRTEFLEN